METGVHATTNNELRPLTRNTAILRRFMAVLAFDSSEAAAFEQILEVSKYLVPGFRV